MTRPRNALHPAAVLLMLTACFHGRRCCCCCCCCSVSVACQRLVIDIPTGSGSSAVITNSLCSGAIYASTHPTDGTGAIMFSDCPSTCVCVHACCGREESSCDRLAIDFRSLQIPASWKFQRLVSDRVLIPHAADAACISLPGRNTHASTCLRRGGSAAYRTSAVLVNK